MSVPLQQVVRVGAYVVKQHLSGRKRYPLVLMLEPLFRCNLACSGCGKIDYPAEILNQRLSVADRCRRSTSAARPWSPSPAASRCCTRRCRRSSQGSWRARSSSILCTNALLLEKKMDQFKPHPYFSWDVHLDGDKEMHDRAVSQEGVYDRAIAAIKKAKRRASACRSTAPCSTARSRSAWPKFFDEVMAMGVDGIMTSPGYAYERAPDQAHFLTRQKTKQLFRDILARGKGKGWKFTQSPLFMDFLAGNQTYHCTPWGKPTRNVFGWQRPCYLLGEGYAKTFKELMDTTEWDKYGTGNYEKCADCMVHSGYESTAVMDAVQSPVKTMMVALKGPRLTGPMAPEIKLDGQRPAEYSFSRHVQDKMAELRHAPKVAEVIDAD